MHAYYVIKTGRVCDNLYQLRHFAMVTRLQQGNPHLLKLDSRGYELANLDQGYITRELFGELEAKMQFDARLSMREFLDGLENGNFASPPKNILVEGDMSIYTATESALSVIKKVNPERFKKANRESWQFVRKLLQSGRIFQRYQERQKDAGSQKRRTTRISIHLRLGDLALVRKAEFSGTRLENLFLDEYLSENTGFVSARKLSKLIQEKKTHVGERYESSPEPADYLRELQSVHGRDNGPPFHTTLCTDGYSRCAKLLARQGNGLSQDEIEKELTDHYLGDLVKQSDVCLIGEHPDQFMPPVESALDADIVLMGFSGFPYCLRRWLRLPPAEVIQVRCGGQAE